MYNDDHDEQVEKETAEHILYSIERRVSEFCKEDKARALCLYCNDQLEDVSAILELFVLGPEDGRDDAASRTLDLACFWYASTLTDLHGWPSLADVEVAAGREL